MKIISQIMGDNGPDEIDEISVAKEVVGNLVKT
jgi:hypothetical protein